MSALLIYVIFATSTAISACYEILRVAIQQVPKDDVLQRSKVLAYISMFCVSWIFAPFVLLVVLVPALTEAAICGLVDRDE